MASSIKKKTGGSVNAGSGAGNALSQATAAGQALAGGLSAAPSLNPNSYSYTPLYKMTPQDEPGAYNLDQPNRLIYTGDSAPAVTQLNSSNQLMGAILDHYGVKAQRGQSLTDAVESALVKHLGLNPKGDVISELANKLGIVTQQNQAPGGKFNSPTAGIFPSSLGLPNAPKPKAGAKGKPAKIDPHTAPWMQIAKKLGVPAAATTPGKPQTMKVQDAAMGIMNMHGDQLASFQQALYGGGYYDSTVEQGSTNAYTPGNLDQATMRAWGNLLNDTAFHYEQGDHVTWMDRLNQQDASVAANGGIASILGKQKAPITVATTDQMRQPAISAYEKELGMKPNDAEVQALTTDYGGQQLAHAGNLPDGQSLGTDTSGVSLVPGVPSAGEAALNFADANNKNAVLAHGMGNAASLISNAISGGIQANTGTNP